MTLNIFIALAIVVAKFGMAGVGKCCGGVGAGEKTQVQSHFLDFFFFNLIFIFDLLALF